MPSKETFDQLLFGDDWWSMIDGWRVEIEDAKQRTRSPQLAKMTSIGLRDSKRFKNVSQFVCHHSHWSLIVISEEILANSDDVFHLDVHEQEEKTNTENIIEESVLLNRTRTNRDVHKIRSKQNEFSFSFNSKVCLSSLRKTGRLSHDKHDHFQGQFFKKITCNEVVWVLRSSVWENKHETKDMSDIVSAKSFCSNEFSEEKCRFSFLNRFTSMFYGDFLLFLFVSNFLKNEMKIKNVCQSFD